MARGGLPEKVTLTPSFPSPDWKGAFKSLLRMFGNFLGPGRGHELAASCLAWNTAGSPLLKQPPEVGQGGEKEGSLDRTNIEATPWLGGTPFLRGAESRALWTCWMLGR